MTTLYEKFDIGLEGHVRILGHENGKTVELLSKRNAIHPEHASIVLASALANRSNDGSLYTMHFGTGGATIDTLGNITYASPNTTGAADLHVPAYSEVIDDTLGAPTGNQMAVKHVTGQLYSDVEIRAIIGTTEPTGQPATSNTGGTNINTSNYVFDEIGLKTNSGLLFSHIVFSPIEKSANRIIEVIYTIRVTVA